MQVRAGGAEPPAAVDVAVERREAFLPVAVDVVSQRVPGLLRRLEEGLEQRACRRPALEDERALVAAPFPPAGQAGLHLLEVRQAVRVIPRVHTRVSRPALVIQRVATLEDHSVDAARAAEHLPAGVVDLAPVHERFRFRLVLPVVEPAPDGVGQGGGHVNEHVERVVRPPGLEYQDPVGRVGAEPVRERAARAAAGSCGLALGRDRPRAVAQRCAPHRLGRVVVGCYASRWAAGTRASPDIAPDRPDRRDRAERRSRGVEPPGSLARNGPRKAGAGVDRSLVIGGRTVTSPDVPRTASLPDALRTLHVDPAAVPAFTGTYPGQPAQEKPPGPDRSANIPNHLSWVHQRYSPAAELPR